MPLSASLLLHTHPSREKSWKRDGLSLGAPWAPGPLGIYKQCLMGNQHWLNDKQAHLLVKCNGHESYVWCLCWLAAPCSCKNEIRSSTQMIWAFLKRILEELRWRRDGCPVDMFCMLDCPRQVRSLLTLIRWKNTEVMMAGSEPHAAVGVGETHAQVNPWDGSVEYIV